MSFIRNNSLRTHLFFLLCVVALQLHPTQASAQTVRLAAAGDSYASGEGAPDEKKNGSIWRGSSDIPSAERAAQTDVSCHRSQRAWPYKVYEDFRDHTHRQVEFASFACSGSVVRNVISSSFKGVGHECESEVAGGALCEIEKRFEGKLVDALLLSIGGNDVGFAPTVQHCILAPDCPRAPVFVPGATTDINMGKDQLRTVYKDLAKAIEDVNRNGKVFIANVFLVEYPNPMENEQGHLCNSSFPNPTPNMTFTRPTGDALDTISGSESDWAANTVIPALNEMVFEGAQMIKDGKDNKYGFYVGGVAERFRRHGFCSSERWINLVRDSFNRQGDHLGSVHPNNQGHDAYRDAVLPALDRIIPPATPGFIIRASDGQPAFAFIPGPMLRLTWSDAGERTVSYQVAVRPAQLNGVLQPLGPPARKWPDSPGAPPRHLGTDDPAWRFVSFVGTTPVTHVPRPTEPSDYAVRACNEAMCSPWSEPARVLPLDESAAVPQLENVTAERAGSRSIRVSWTPRPPSANTFVEVALTRTSTWRGAEAPAGQNELTISSLANGQYSVTARQCTWSFVSRQERESVKCSAWSEPVYVSLTERVANPTNPELPDTRAVRCIRLQQPRLPPRPRVPPEDFRIRLPQQKNR